MTSPDVRTRQIASDTARSLVRLRTAVEEDPAIVDLARARRARLGETATWREHTCSPWVYLPGCTRAGAIRDALASPLAQALVHHLSRSGPTTTADLTRLTGCGSGTVRKHLHALRDAGLIIGDDDYDEGLTTTRRGRRPVLFALAENAVDDALDAIGRYLAPASTTAAPSTRWGMDRTHQRDGPDLAEPGRHPRG